VRFGDILAIAEVDHLQDIRQFVELFDNLFQGSVVASCHDRHARGGRIGRGRDVQRVNIVTAPAEQARHSRQHAELVLHQNGDSVSHKIP